MLSPSKINKKEYNISDIHFGDFFEIYSNKFSVKFYGQIIILPTEAYDFQFDDIEQPRNIIIKWGRPHPITTVSNVSQYASNIGYNIIEILDGLNGKVDEWEWKFLTDPKKIKELKLSFIK